VLSVACTTEGRAPARPEADAYPLARGQVLVGVGQRRRRREGLAREADGGRDDGTPPHGLRGTSLSVPLVRAPSSLPSAGGNERGRGWREATTGWVRAGALEQRHRQLSLEPPPAGVSGPAGSHRIGRPVGTDGALDGGFARSSRVASGVIGASHERDVADSLLRANQMLKISDGLQGPCDKGMGHAGCNFDVLGTCREARIPVQASMSTRNTNEAAGCRLL